MTCETCKYWANTPPGYQNGYGDCDHILNKFVWGPDDADIGFWTPPQFWCAEYDKRKKAERDG